MILRSLVVLGCLWVAACGGGRSESAGPGAAQLPDGAIAVGHDLYMVPLAKPVGGCPAFRAFSPNRSVVQAIFYRDPDGRFVMNRREAGCT